MIAGKVNLKYSKAAMERSMKENKINFIYAIIILLSVIFAGVIGHFINKDVSTGILVGLIISGVGCFIHYKKSKE